MTNDLKQAKYKGYCPKIKIRLFSKSFQIERVRGRSLVKSVLFFMKNMGSLPTIPQTPPGMQMINIHAIFIRDYRLRDNLTRFNQIFTIYLAFSISPFTKHRH